VEDSNIIGETGKGYEVPAESTGGKSVNCGVMRKASVSQQQNGGDRTKADVRVLFSKLRGGACGRSRKFGDDGHNKNASPRKPAPTTVRLASLSWSEYYVVLSWRARPISGTVRPGHVTNPRHLLPGEYNVSHFFDHILL
jgi:hypothetical protein